MESNESKPLMTCRKHKDEVKTGFGQLIRDEFERRLLTVRMASGIEVARMRSRLLCGTWESVIPMPRKRCKRKSREHLSTNAGYRGGATRSSAEATVMVVERRGCLILAESREQPVMEGFS